MNVIILNFNQNNKLPTMKTKIAFLIATILFSTQSFSQEFCGTTSNSTYQKISSLTRMKYGNPPTEPAICINLYFHTVRDDNGVEDNLLRVSVDDIVTKLNQDYASHNISFTNYGEEYIDDSRYLEVFGSEFADLMAINNNPNAINIYLVDSGQWKGKAGCY